MRRFEFDTDALQVSLTNEEILSDLLYPYPPSDTGGATERRPWSAP